MSAQAPGQARKAWRATWNAFRATAGLDPVPPEEDDALDATWVASWTAAAVAAQQPLRDAVAALTARLDASADATHPSRKSEVEREVAAALRQILEES